MHRSQRDERGRPISRPRYAPLVPGCDASCSFTDGVLTIRSLRAGDLEMDLSAKDDEQIDWLWEPGQRALWEAMSPEEQRHHARRGLEEAERSFGEGPKWRFAVDTATDRYVAYLDCDLANNHVPHGQANISYAAHPDHRSRGYVSGGVRLGLRFLAACTSASVAHLVVDAENVASLRVARAVGAAEVERWTNEQGRVMVRHVIAVPRGEADAGGPRGRRSATE